MKKKKKIKQKKKVAILKRHLVDGECVSSICESLKLQPSQFYSWQKTFFENGASAFKTKKSILQDIRAKTD